MDHDYDALADAAERGELTPIPGTELHGEAAAAEVRRMLLETTGTTDLDELTRMAMGRPAVGTSSGASPVVRARVPQALKDRVNALARRQHRKESDIVREALAAYVQLQEA